MMAEPSFACAGPEKGSGPESGWEFCAISRSAPKRTSHVAADHIPSIEPEAFLLSHCSEASEIRCETG